MIHFYTTLESFDCHLCELVLVRLNEYNMFHNDLADATQLMKIRYTLTLATLLASLGTVHAEMLHDLSQVPGHIQDRDNQQIYAQQMNGTPLPQNGLGIPLPAGITQSQIIQLLQIDQHQQFPVLIGVKPWRQSEHSFIALVCSVSSQAEQQEQSKHDNEASCGDAVNVELAVFQQDGQALHLIGAPLTWRMSSATDKDPMLTDWDHTNLDDGPLDAVVSPTELVRLDLANYQLTPEIRAFGLRGSLSEGFAGGGKIFQTLTLFAVIDGQLQAVASLPIAFMDDLAGEWHKDGTRERDVSEGSNLILIGKPDETGFNTLKVKEKNGHGTAYVLHWDPKSKRYH